MGSKAMKRIESVDALRGLALLGLFLVHMVEYFELYWADPQPGMVHDLVFGMFGGKAYALLAICFGFSFHALFESGRARGAGYSRLFFRRMALLAAIGLLHGLVYRGDIIVVLAVLGCLLVPLDRVKSNGALMWIATFCLMQPLLLLRIAAGQLGMTWAVATPGFYSDPAMAAYTSGGLVEVLQANLWLGQVNKWSFYLESGRIMQMFGLFVLGALAGRKALFAEGVLTPRTLIGLVLVSVVALAGLFLWRDYWVFMHGGEQGVSLYVQLLLSEWVGLVGTVLWVLVFLLAWSSPLKMILHGLVAPGRLTLTLYIAQSVMFVPFFYHFGAGAFAWISQEMALLMGIAAFVPQLLWARWWLGRFHYGPLEWLWRAGTLGRRDIPWRRVAHGTS